VNRHQFRSFLSAGWTSLSLSPSLTRAVCTATAHVLTVPEPYARCMRNDRSLSHCPRVLRAGWTSLSLSPSLTRAVCTVTAHVLTVPESYARCLHSDRSRSHCLRVALSRAVCATILHSPRFSTISHSLVVSESHTRCSHNISRFPRVPHALRVQRSHTLPDSHTAVCTIITHCSRVPRYVNIDSCWASMERGPDGELTANATRFPGGITALADYVHNKVRSLRKQAHCGVCFA
jgi:hypothetical protein